MRFTLLLASSALAASLVLSGCSTSGGSQTIPGGTQTSMSHRGGPQIEVLGGKRDTSCPSTYIECTEISNTSPATQEWCIVYSGTSGCTDLYPGTWTWSWPTYKTGKKGFKKSKKLKASSSPNPGNPTELTISTKLSKSTKGKIKYAVGLNACNSASSCLSGYYIGISIL